MVMLLQRQPAARLDDDALDLVAVAIVDRLIAAPGTMHLEMILGDLRRDASSASPTSRFKPLASFCRDTSTASSVATTTRSSTPSSATSALSVETLQLRESSNTAAALRGVALRILVRQFPHRMPGADVGPAAGDRHDRGARGLLHHRIVDRDRLGRAERVGLERDEAEIAAGPGRRRR